jgi:hypothetical protein
LDLLGQVSGKEDRESSDQMKFMDVVKLLLLIFTIFGDGLHGAQTSKVSSYQVS